MKSLREIHYSLWLPIIILVFGCCAIIYCYNKPLSDFANYYFGAQLINANDPQAVYDVHRFNETVQSSGENNVFLDHTSVPPQTPVFYKPFTVIKNPYVARAVFNLIGLSVFVFMLHVLLKQYTEVNTLYAIGFLIAMLVPVYQNISFGQTYLFIAALLIATWLAHLRGKLLLAGVWLGIAIVLKITPVILLLYFVARKHYRVVITSLIAFLLITFVTSIITGHEVLDLYYFDLFPRIADGYINDPYSNSYHGLVVLLRHLGQFDAILNPDAYFNFSPQFIAAVNGVVLLALLGLTIFRASIAQLTDTNPIVLLLLLLYIGSGYSSTYSLLILPPFLLVTTSKRQLVCVLLTILICALPPRLFTDAPVVFQHFKLYLFLTLFILLIAPGIRKFRLSLMTTTIMVFFGIVQIRKVIVSDQLPQYGYFSKAITQDYITDYSIYNDTLKATAYSMRGKELLSLPLTPGTTCTHPMPPQNLYRDHHHLLYKNIICRNDSVIFLCDVGRGVGLYHIFAVPRAQFPFEELK
jgi:hypothetical protein